MPEDSGLFRDKGKKLRSYFPNSSFLGEWRDCISKTSHREARIRKVLLLKMAVIFQFFYPSQLCLKRKWSAFKLLHCSVFAGRQACTSASWIEWHHGEYPEFDQSIFHAVSLLLNYGEVLGPYKAAGVPLLRSFPHFLWLLPVISLGVSLSIKHRKWHIYADDL